MALNEHKNLTEGNLHNPKGFSTAGADTLCGKSAGNTLEWVSKSLIKTNIYQMQGYGTAATTNYYMAGLISSDNKSPFQCNTSYGSSTIGSASLAVNTLFRTAGYPIQDDCTVSRIRGWITGSVNEVVTFALVRWRPVADDASVMSPVLVDEATVTTNGNTKMFAVNETTITTGALVAGDIIMPMIKSATASSNVIYFNITVEVGYDN